MCHAFPKILIESDSITIICDRYTSNFSIVCNHQSFININTPFVLHSKDIFKQVLGVSSGSLGPLDGNIWPLSVVVVLWWVISLIRGLYCFIGTIGGSDGSSGIFSESLRAFSGPLGALDVIIGTSASGGCLEVSVLGDYVPLVGHLGPSCWKFGASSGSLGPPVGH